MVFINQFIEQLGWFKKASKTRVSKNFHINKIIEAIKTGFTLMIEGSNIDV